MTPTLLSNLEVKPCGFSFNAGTARSDLVLPEVVERIKVGRHSYRQSSDKGESSEDEGSGVIKASLGATTDFLCFLAFAFRGVGVRAFFTFPFFYHSSPFVFL